jgi:phosphatidylinositol alpha-1,6-mannosyltransferase
MDSTILMVTRPIVPPWNEGSKNTAWQIAKRATRHRFRLMTAHTVTPPAASPLVSWAQVYSQAKFTFHQKIRLFWWLLRGDKEAEIYHFLFVPTKITSLLLSKIVNRHKRTIQTVPSLYTDNLSPKEAQALFFAERVVVISEHTAQKLRGLGVKQVVRISAGVDIDSFFPYPNRDGLRKQFGLPANKPIAIFSGELSRLGSIELLLDIIPTLVATNSDLHIVLASPIRLPLDVQRRKQAQQTIQQLGLEANVHFIGEVDDFPALLNACDMYLFPVSRMTGKIDTPLTLLEAMACGLPVIVTNISPLNEVVNREVGFAIPSGSSDAFGQAILQLAEEPNRRQQLGQSATTLVQKHYSVQKMVEAYEALYDELS